MKKIIIGISIIIMILSLNKEEQIKIPKESIRFRIIANSNNEEDQTLKKKIVENLSTSIKHTSNIGSLEKTRKNIQQRLPEFSQIVERTLKENQKEEVFNINYGKNYFPEKEYKNVIYPEGEYESLVITLGTGKGENFWCVLFPPLCLIDEDNEKIEYKSIVKDILSKYF